MLNLFNIEVSVYKKNKESDDAGGDSISFKEQENLWRVRISTLDGDYVENLPGREYPSMIRIVGEVRGDIREGDRIAYSGFFWELVSVIRLRGNGSIPDYIRAKAQRIGDGEN
jgi:hypothetical protein